MNIVILTELSNNCLHVSGRAFLITKGLYSTLTQPHYISLYEIVTLEEENPVIKIQQLVIEKQKLL